MGKRNNYNNEGTYDNTDNSLVFITDNPRMYSFLYSEGWVKSQEGMLQNGLSEQDYADFAALQKDILQRFEKVRDIKFGINTNIPGSGVPFRHPDWQSVSDTEQVEEIISEEHSETENLLEITPYYQRYLSIQKKYPDSIVLIRLGDFYEAMGENAVKVTKALDLMLTGRDVGLAERIPMTGFPCHVAERYIDKLLEQRSVIVAEEDKEPIFYEAYEQHSDRYDEQPNPEYDAYESLDENDDKEPEITETVSQPQEKKPGKSIRERHGKKQKPQMSLFDLMDGERTDEQSAEDKVIEWHLKQGSGFADGKYRIYKKYFEDPTVKEFADFLKHEYGTGGYHVSGYDQSHDSRGLTLAYRDKDSPENDVTVKLNWTQTANRIADLIDDNNYFNDNDKAEYERFKAKITASIVTETEEEYLFTPPEEHSTTETSLDNNTDLNEIEFDQSELGGAKARFKGNIEAIKLIERLYRENRNPAPDEKKTLARYVGWGGLSQAFDEHNLQWQNEYSELRRLLAPEDYDRAKASVLSAHYTSKEVIGGIYAALQSFGVKGNNRILEPAMGTGNFFGFLPKGISENAQLYGVELDNLTGKIAAKLYPQANIQIKGFEETNFANNSFDIVVGNVPFGAFSVYDSEYAKHNFVWYKCLGIRRNRALIFL